MVRKILPVLIYIALTNDFAEAEVFKVTAYCNCFLCTEKPKDHKAYGITASGKIASPGTVAVDKKVIPLGSRLKILGLKGVFRAEDTGKRIKGRHIEIWFPTHKKAKRFGVQHLEVKISDLSPK